MHATQRQRARRIPRGFTLLEIMVAAGILLFVVGAALNMLVTVNVASNRVTKIGSTQDVARQALDLLANDIRMAGLGASKGVVGVAPVGTVQPFRVPVVFSGPDVTVYEPGKRGTLVTNSIFIVSLDPSSLTVGADGQGMQAIVASAATTAGSPLTLACSTAAGSGIYCDDVTTFPNTPPLLSSPGIPLLVGDLRNAVYLRPTKDAPTDTAPAGTKLTQINFTESSFGVISVDPTAPFGLPAKSVAARANVVHWFLRQDDPNAPPRLYRSQPTMLFWPSSFTCQRDAVSTAISIPFQDETTDPALFGPRGLPYQGVEMGAGPIQSLQIRYVVDTTGTDDPTKFTLVSDWQGNNRINFCDGDTTTPGYTPAITQLREVRIQMVSISSTPDLTVSGGQANGTDKTHLVGYSTPVFEPYNNSAATTTANANTTTDPYPRRAFVTRVTPRAIQGTRL